MAAALHPLRTDAGTNSLYPRVLMKDFEFGDNRYPTLPNTIPQSVSSPPSSSTNNLDGQYLNTNTNAADVPRLSLSWASTMEPWTQPDLQHTQKPPPSALLPEQTQEPQRTSLSYALPPGAARRVLERYSLDDNNQRPQSRTSNETKPTFVDSTVIGRAQLTVQNISRASSPQGGRTSPNPRPSPRSLPIPPNNSTNSSTPSSPPTPQFPSIMPLSASPAFSPPVAPNHRAYPQQPTFVTQANAPNPIKTVYTPIVPPQEEICVECAMRDQDMADVDVTSLGVWERASDVLFEELKQRQLDEEAQGIVVDPSRPRLKGGRLTEQNVKLWLSINPREPASRQQTLNAYIKSQRNLLEAEALAHSRAMQEAKQLDSRMRDAYSQLRRSAYDIGSSSTTDDLGGVRIKPPNSPVGNSTQQRSHSREVTLLENGMIVEHVDVRKEEKEARERRKKDEKRARKSSRSSVLDVTSIISAQSNTQLIENGLKPYSRYSQASSARPPSVLTSPFERHDLPHAYSQASFSDVHSLGSLSPRRTRFFGMKNLSTGWRSQDSLAPSGVSGSMVDMHVALQRENLNPYPLTSQIDLNTPRRSQIWPPTEFGDVNASQIVPEDKVKKKKGGLAKIWRIVTGKNEGTQQRNATSKNDGNPDDLPLTPPPSLSYLVNRGPTDVHSVGMRHASTPSLPSAISPKFGLSSAGVSPPTAPSSLLPSPTSLRPPFLDVEIADNRSAPNNDANGPVDEPEPKYRRDERNENIQTNTTLKSITSESELRVPNTNSFLSSNSNIGQIGSASLSREKSLPPIPPGEQPAQILPSDIRPRTVYTYDYRTLPPGSSPAHDFLPPKAPFRTVDNRRQSFGGMSSRPNIGSQTPSTSRTAGFDSRRSLGPRYDEFGSSRRSLGRIEHVHEQSLRSNSPLPSKRKSKFVFSSLLGKKDKREPAEYVGDQFPSAGYLPYDVQDDSTINGYATSASRHSTFSSGLPIRSSVTSKKVEELVLQDPEFIAYRYPSSDQRLDLRR